MATLDEKSAKGQLEERRGEDGAPPHLEPPQMLSFLTPPLRRTLGRLQGAPDGVPELALLTLPYEGSLKTLAELGLVELDQRMPDGVGSRLLGHGETPETAELIDLMITDLGRDVMALCAAEGSDREVENLSGEFRNLTPPADIQLKLNKA